MLYAECAKMSDIPAIPSSDTDNALRVQWYKDTPAATVGQLLAFRQHCDRYGATSSAIARSSTPDERETADGNRSAPVLRAGRVLPGPDTAATQTSTVRPRPSTGELAVRDELKAIGAGAIIMPAADFPPAIDSTWNLFTTVDDSLNGPDMRWASSPQSAGAMAPHVATRTSLGKQKPHASIFW